MNEFDTGFNGLISGSDLTEFRWKGLGRAGQGLSESVRYYQGTAMAMAMTMGNGDEESLWGLAGWIS